MEIPGAVWESAGIHFHCWLKTLRAAPKPAGGKFEHWKGKAATNPTDNIYHGLGITRHYHIISEILLEYLCNWEDLTTWMIPKHTQLQAEASGKKDLA